MKHITTANGISYIYAFPNDGGNDLGLEVNSLYFFNESISKYDKSERDLVDVINDAIEVHNIPSSRWREN